MRSTFLPGPDANKRCLFLRRSHVHFHISRQNVADSTASAIVRFHSMYRHFTSRTVSSSIIPSGDAPRIPEEWNQIPVCFISNPVLKVNALMASSSLFPPHRTAFTLHRLHSPRRRLTSEGVILFAFRTELKLLAVRRHLLVRNQAGLSRWPTVSSLILTVRFL